MDDPGTPAGNHLKGTLLADRYLVLSALDEGGMAKVYLAHDTKLARKVVVKIPRREFLAVDGFRARFTREVGSLARLQHPNIGRIQDLGEHDGVPFAVLDYLGGGDLKQAIERAGGKMSPEQVVQWLPQIARALDFIHAKGTLHRDVKPQNVLFDERGHAFLADFGIATTLGTMSDDATTLGDAAQLTMPGGFVGTPSFAPPEAIHRQLTPAYDQYSLGVMVYLALSGALPIRARESSEALLFAKIHQDPTPLAEPAPDVPAAVARVVMRSLARDAKLRFPSCGDFADAFVRATTESRGGPRRAARSPLWLWAIAAAVAAVAGATSLWQLRDGRSKAREPAADVRGDADRGEPRAQPTGQPLAPVPTAVTTLEPSAPAERSSLPSAAVAPPTSPGPSASVERAPSPSAAARATSSPAPAAEPTPPAPSPTPVAGALEPIAGMVAVPAGSFLSGCNAKVDAECERDEGSARRRDVAEFWIDRTEVTVADYRRCVDAGRCTAAASGDGCNAAMRGREQHPVNCVDAAQAEAYCAFVGKRLPTEWEWEKAARGSDGRKHPWGNRDLEDGAGKLANVADASLQQEREGWALGARYDDGRAETAPVGTYPAGASPSGALDMAGNVWEWTSSALDGDRGRRVIRGGSWTDPASEARTSARLWSDPTHRRSAGGFRCARSAG